MQRSEPCASVTWHLGLQAGRVLTDASVHLDLCQLLGLEPLLGSGFFLRSSGPIYLLAASMHRGWAEGSCSFVSPDCAGIGEPLFGVCTHQEKYQCSEEGPPLPSRKDRGRKM